VLKAVRSPGPVVKIPSTVVPGYPYLDHLITLDQSTERGENNVPELQERLGATATHIRAELFRSNLLHHEDQQYTNWILQGLTKDFRIGFHRSGVVLASSQTNMLSAMNHKDVVISYLSNELQAGQIACVSPVERAQGVHISPFGVTPKKGKANCWRLILDLSFPDDKSMNDGICKEWCSLQYLSMSEVVDEVLSKGQRALLGKMDIKQA